MEKQPMNYSTGDVMLTRNHASENKEKNDADEFQQQCFESLKKYVEEKIISEGQFLRMTTIANYYRQLQESMKLQVKGDTP